MNSSPTLFQDVFLSSQSGTWFSLLLYNRIQCAFDYGQVISEKATMCTIQQPAMKNRAATVCFVSNFSPSSVMVVVLSVSMSFTVDVRVCATVFVLRHGACAQSVLVLLDDKSAGIP